MKVPCVCLILLEGGVVVLQNFICMNVLIKFVPSTFRWHLTVVSLAFCSFLQKTQSAVWLCKKIVMN